jgi:hypothetical protein
MKSKTYSESQLQVSRPTRPSILSASEALTKSEVVALRQKKKSIDADLRKAVTKCLASV